MSTVRCNATHPGPPVRLLAWRGRLAQDVDYDELTCHCGRFGGHTGEHAGYGFSTKDVLRWPQGPVLAPNGHAAPAITTPVRMGEDTEEL